MAGRLAIAAVTALIATATQAANVDYAASRVEFTFTQMNVPVEGRFRQFQAQIQFDRANPERSRADVEIALASIDTGSRDGDAESQRKPWFNALAFPEARFVSNKVLRAGPDRYEVVGKLTIKGRAQDVTVPMEVHRTGDVMTFDGRFTLNRLAFAIGEGEWADTDTVADEVLVRFRIVQYVTGAEK
jgi:polyisoprenoid-binding protein YceI